MIKLKDILKEASTSESFSQMKNLMSNGIPMIFPREEGELQKKYHDKIMKLKDLIVEKKDDKIQVQGVGVFTYKSLKKNVEKKLKDLTRRNRQGSHYGVGENQFKMLQTMWKALRNYEENN